MQFEELQRDDAGDAEVPEVKFRSRSSWRAHGRRHRDPEPREKRLARMIRMVTLVAALSPAEARAMASRDYVLLQELLGNFL